MRKLHSIQKKISALGEKGVTEIALRAFNETASHAEKETMRELIFKALVVRCDFLYKKDEKAFIDWCELDDRYRKLNDKYQKLLKGRKATPKRKKIILFHNIKNQK